MSLTALAETLRSIETPRCLAAAEKLLNTTSPEFDLHLRQAGLTGANTRRLAKALNTDDSNGPRLRSFSASYNPDLGNEGAIALAQAFPDTLTELGMVGCAIGDAGGRALFEWAARAPSLRMICIEDNAFSQELRREFQTLAEARQQLFVVV